MWLIDLHVHFKRRAKDEAIFAEEQVARARELGLNGIAFTEHGQFLDEKIMGALRRANRGFRIYSGIEVACEGEDFLVFGKRDDVFCEPFGDYSALNEQMFRNGGAICLAHPFRRRDHLPEGIYSLPPHAIEIRSRHTPIKHYRLIHSLAHRWGALLLENSDAHKPKQIGGFFNYFHYRPNSDEELAAMLRML